MSIINLAAAEPPIEVVDDAAPEVDFDELKPPSGLKVNVKGLSRAMIEFW
jgi:hypothetical protein